ncbi:IclR family transcriptional regulator [Verminephrobacter eiseniae]|uniref:IclR family transcriptional regulator n=1 Tax=Verminephrobacter eiseniae TaxID=364317 RepID=UPI00223867D4|nr:IclR family transcriptional regulator [Verminephrobacter eiseniae]MCW5236974.1 IclR family transcriptional regulator [Verminephrobacter eiseniae]
MKPTTAVPQKSAKPAAQKAAAQKAAVPMAASAKRPQYAAPALEKGIDILELLTDAEHGLGMAEIAQKLHRSVGEIFRMVVTLQRRNWLYADRADCYHLTTRMFELAHRNRPIRTLVEAALPSMQLVAKQALQSCHLAVFEAGRILVVAQVQAPGPLSFGVRTGSVVGMFNTASGQVMLAFRSPQERERLLEQNAILTGEPGVLRGDALAGVDKVAADGFACSPSQQLRGVTNLGCPVWGSNGHVVAAVVIPFVERLDAYRGPTLEETLLILKNAAVDISKALGQPGFS